MAFCVQAGKDPSANSLAFNRSKSRLQSAGSCLFHVLHEELELSATLVEGNTAAHADVIAGAGGEAQSLVAPFKHGAADLGIAVL